MDARLYDDVLQFTYCIKDTPEYREYREKREALETRPDLLMKAEKLREENFRMYNGLDDDEEVLPEVIKFADDNEEVYREPMIKEYLTAEAAFCKMMREVLDMTMEQIDFGGIA